MMASLAAVGVDNGGTWIRLKGLSAAGRCVWSLKKPSPTVEKLPAFLKKHLSRLRGPLIVLAIGSRGLWKPSKRRAVKRALRGLAKTIVVMSDVEAAWLAAFGATSNEQRATSTGNRLIAHRSLLGTGIIVISGTGSIAYGRKADGTFARAGGLGPDKGDEGSGYWIGRQWLRKLPSPPLRGETGRTTFPIARPVPVRYGRAVAKGDRGEGGAVRQIASIAPLIIGRAKKGNLLARKVTQDAQRHLSRLVIDLILKFRWTGVVPLAVSGSVLENKWFKRGFLKMLHAKGVKFRFIRKKADQALAPLNVFLHR